MVVVDVASHLSHPFPAVFAPRNDAFDDKDLDFIIADTVLLTEFVLNHVVAGKFLLQDLEEQDQILQALGGSTIIVRNRDGKLTLETAKISTSDVQAKNGIIHIVDDILVTLPDREPSSVPSKVPSVSPSKSRNPTLAPQS